MRRVQEALSGLGIPAFAGIWRATSSNPNAPEQYLAYSSTAREEAHHDDRVVAMRTFVYLNLWSLGDPTWAAARVRDAMYAAGFGLVEETDRGYNEPGYSTGTRMYTIQWTWSLYEDVP
ncbi:MAG: hypothetical protein AB9880_05015 [Christensenellales bacterium]